VDEELAMEIEIHCDADFLLIIYTVLYFGYLFLTFLS
jgi:hypothetical protein